MQEILRCSRALAFSYPMFRKPHIHRLVDLTWHQPAAVHGSGSTMCSVKFGVVIIARFLFSNIIFNQRICDLCTRVDVNIVCNCVYTQLVYTRALSQQ